MIKLRDYQQEIFNRVLEHGKENSIIQLASGAGKSYIIAKLAELYKAQGLDVVVLVPWIVVRYQIVELLEEHGINVPVSSANLVNRHKNKIKNIDVFLIDEAHHSSADSYLEAFKAFPDAQRVGFSATPMRNDDKDLIGVYQNLIQSDITTKDLIDRGYLSKFVYYAPSNSDIASHSISKDKLNVGSGYSIDRGTALPNRTVYGDVVDTWLKYGKNYQTVLFAPDVETSKKYAKLLRERGIVAESIDSSMPNKDIANIINRYRKGEIKILCNYNMISEGFDMKECDCVILTSTTFSYPMFYQRAYRALRKNGNRHAIVIDHGDNAFVHGMLDDIKYYSLTESEERKQKEEREKVFERAGSNWAFDEILGVELEEVYRYGKGYDSKYDKLVDKANSLANMEGFMLLVQVQTELKIVSAPGQPAWAYAYALSKGYKDIPVIE